VINMFDCQKLQLIFSTTGALPTIGRHGFSLKAVTVSIISGFHAFRILPFPFGPPVLMLLIPSLGMLSVAFLAPRMTAISTC